mgnify:CR=1 FL=1
MVGLLAGAAKGLLKKPKKVDPKKFAGKMEETKASSKPKGGALAIRPVESIVKVVDIKPKEPKVKAKGGPLAEIQESVHSIVVALKGEQDAKKKRAVVQKKKNQKKKRLNLEALSELGKTTGKIVGGLASATGITNLWGAIWKTLGILFAGWAMNFLPQILEFVKKFVDITTNVVRVAKPIVGFIWDTLTWITDKGVKLLAMVTGIEPEEALDNSLLKNITEIQKRIPLIESAFAWFAILNVANFFKKDDPKVKNQQDAKNKNRNKRNTEGTKTRTGKQHQLEVKRRHSNLKKIKRNKFFNKIRRNLGLEEVDIKPQLDTTPTGTRKNPVVETPKTKVKVDVPTNVPKKRGFLGVDWGKRAGQLSDFAGEKARGIQRGVTGAIETGGEIFNKQVSQRVSGWLENVNPSKWLQRLADSDLVGSGGARRLLGLIDNPALKKALGFAPFVGDAIIFISDILRGVHWTRALMRTATALAIDSGFNALLTATVAAAPFTGGASLALTAALTAAYMAADMAGGWAIGTKIPGSHNEDYQPGDGIGQVLGDVLANALGLPKKQGMPGEEGKAWETMFGSKGSEGSATPKVNLDKVLNSITDEEKEAIARVDGVDKITEKPKKISKDFTIGKKTYDLSKEMGGLSREEFDALDKIERRRILQRQSIWQNQNKEEWVANIKGDANVKSNDATAISQSASYDDKAGKSTIIPVPIGEMQSGSSGGTTLVGTGDGVNTYETVNKLNKTGTLSKHFSD